MSSACNPPKLAGPRYPASMPVALSATLPLVLLCKLILSSVASLSHTSPQQAWLATTAQFFWEMYALVEIWPPSLERGQQVGSQEDGKALKSRWWFVSLVGLQGRRCRGRSRRQGRRLDQTAAVCAARLTTPSVSISMERPKCIGNISIQGKAEQDRKMHYVLMTQ